jgi:hypothetical protein
MIHQHRALARWDWQGADTFSASHRRDGAALPPSFSSARQVGAPRRRKARHVYSFEYPKTIRCLKNSGNSPPRMAQENSTEIL